MALQKTACGLETQRASFRFYLRNLRTAYCSKQTAKQKAVPATALIAFF